MKKNLLFFPPSVPDGDHPAAVPAQVRRLRPLRLLRRRRPPQLRGAVLLRRRRGGRPHLRDGGDPGRDDGVGRRLVPGSVSFFENRFFCLFFLDVALVVVVVAVAFFTGVGEFVAGFGSF